MNAEKNIYGKHDDAHHDGRASNVRREQEVQDVLDDLFFDLYGIPFPWARGLAKMGIGGWDQVLQNFEELISKPVDDGDIDVV